MLAESLRERLPRDFARLCLVNAFNSVGNACVVDAQFKGGKPTLFICRNDEGAKKAAGAVRDRFGGETAAMGKAEAAAASGPLCTRWRIPGLLRCERTHALKLLD